MPRIPFDQLPDHGRLWVFPLTRTLEPGERETTMAVVDVFLEQWAAHGVPLRSARELRDGRFLLIGVDVDAEAPSGCSIDALVRELRELGGRLDAGFVDHAPVWFRSAEGVRTVTRAEFRALAESGEVDATTRVFDTSITSVEALRSGQLEGPASASWHGRVFFPRTATG